jgi:signal transduction histidine kinase
MLSYLSFQHLRVGTVVSQLQKQTILRGQTGHMLIREDMRYGKQWIRALCCLAVAIAVSNGVYFQVFTSIENLFRQVVMYGEVATYRFVPQVVEILIVFCICLMLSIPKIEQPIMMILCGIGLTLAYLLGVLVLLLTRNLILPVASPVVSVLGTTIVLETMAWSEERSTRRQLERLEEIRQQLTDMLVHDLKKRMSSILTSFSLLEKDTDSAKHGQAEQMTTIRTSADRMLILINNLLDIRKFNEEAMRLHRETVPLRIMLQESIQEHMPAGNLTGVSLSLEGHDELKVYVDRQIFWRILSNLLWNALQHAPHGSEIEIGYGLVDRVSVNVYVANRGKPIPQHEKDTLFRPFASLTGKWRKRPIDSTGLGLAFCKLAIEAHGGAIDIESPWEKYGDGVKILLHLPV